MSGAPLRTAVVVGNPRPGSRTLAAATHLATELTGHPPEVSIDLATVGGRLLDADAPEVDALVAEVRRSDLVVVASPTYKAAYTGLLKAFLDRFAADALRGRVAVPLMLGGGPAHALAPEWALRPVLTAIGASVVLPGLFVVDREHDDPDAYADWLATARPVLDALSLHPIGAPV